MRFAMAMLLVLTSFAGVAQAIPVSVIAAGQPVKGAEVCIWKAGRPVEPDHALLRVFGHYVRFG